MNKKFFMRDESGNYASGVATYVTNLYDAKIFEGNPEEYSKFKNEIILVDSKKGLELLAKEMEVLDGIIPQEEIRLRNLKERREKLYFSTPNIKKYIQMHNQRIHPLIGISEDEKQEIIKRICQE